MVLVFFLNISWRDGHRPKQAGLYQLQPAQFLYRVEDVQGHGDFVEFALCQWRAFEYLLLSQCQDTQFGSGERYQIL